MTQYKDTPGRYQEIECSLCFKTALFCDAVTDGWFFVDEEEHVCDACGEDMNLVHCCFCGKTMQEPFTCNPWPVSRDLDARCCNECNGSIVIPARIKRERMVNKARGRVAAHV